MRADQKVELISGIQVMIIILSLLVMLTTFTVFKHEIKSSTRASEEIIDSITQKAMIRSRWCWLGIYLPTILSFLILQCIKIKVDPSPEIITTMQILTWIVFIIAFFVLSFKWGWVGMLSALVIHIVIQTILGCSKPSLWGHGGHGSDGYYSGC